MNKKPICKIINAAFSYILEVDGESISFQADKDYFIEHYKKLGYKVIYDNSYWEKKHDN